jgi:selT/selW/selH-like putative selenoprotein
LKKLGYEVQMIEGGGGIFDVKVDGKLVFSKHETGRFPNPGEVPKLLGK